MSTTGPRPQVALVAAVARHGVMGRGGRLPWHLPEDLRFFKQATLGTPVIMGRSTWDALPAPVRPLPGRRNIVLTRQPDWSAPGAEVAHTLDEALRLAGDVPRVSVIGGAQVYAAAMPVADELVLTEIDHDFAGDTWFPAWPREQFDELHRESHRAAPPNDFGYAFVTYRRRR